MKNIIKNLRIGVDIENIGRFKKLDRVKDKEFLEKIFTKKELAYCFSKKNSAQHLAVRYSGKEAVIKALSDLANKPGKSNPSYRDIEILNGKRGAPSAIINNKHFPDLQVQISLSHCEDKAIAFAVVMNGKQDSYISEFENIPETIIESISIPEPSKPTTEKIKPKKPSSAEKKDSEIDAVKKIISESFKIDFDDITMEKSPEDIETWDSLGQLVLINNLEKEFKVVFEMEEIFEIASIGDIYKILKRKNAI